MDEFLELSEAELKMVLQKVENLTLIAALRDAKPEVFQRVCNAISERACDLLWEDLCSARALQLSRQDVKTAQEAVQEIIRQVLRRRQ